MSRVYRIRVKLYYETISHADFDIDFYSTELQNFLCLFLSLSAFNIYLATENKRRHVGSNHHHHRLRSNDVHT